MRTEWGCVGNGDPCDTELELLEELEFIRTNAALRASFVKFSQYSQVVRQPAYLLM
jgi:hypothetical protein